jgi:2,3,4,5-tetrahydropyridine-2-carboxylate N-succinyltransferase
VKEIETKEEFKKFVTDFQNSKHYKKPLAFGIARVDFGQKHTDKVLQATFPLVNWDENFGSAAVFMSVLQECGAQLDFDTSEAIYEIDENFVKHTLSCFAPYLYEAREDAHKNVQVVKNLDTILNTTRIIQKGEFRLVFIFEDTNPKSIESVYLKLYALSLGKVPLRSINLNGAFGILPNVAWHQNKPIELEWLREKEIELKLKGEYPNIDFVDKFPRFLQHIIPADNTRILDSSKVRFGAGIANGTTVMPGASYINFNAGTTGPSMVEGRISSSAIVKDGSDVGGGASILGVLSGTNGNPVTIGKNCLLGANSVTGIPLGDGCIVDAGIAVLEGTKFFIDEQNFKALKKINFDLEEKSNGIYKGIELSGKNGIHFRYDSVKNKMVALRSKKEVKLNEELH